MADALAKLIGTLIGIVLVSFLLSYPLMIIWNTCLVPAVPAIKEVEWLQMWGISLLIGSMFKGS